MPPALTLAVVLALTGCGSDSDDSTVASAAGDTSDSKNKDAADGANASLSPEQMGVKFASCMRENGIPMEDPEPGKGIRFKMDSSIPKATRDKAMEACREYQPQGKGGAGADPKRAEAMRKHAACMRENGVDAFPDPQPGGGIMINEEIAKDPDFQGAQEKCKDLMGGGLAEKN
ncbi:hypothetical protein ACIHCQ_03555 [Streptomyces sp. NPDC052236]|uniref:hypothetical protein n=1 Tax=Streptomyces sp. NPDC052236 TaxID=3365686 RepID=UPI0037D7F568